MIIKQTLLRNPFRPGNDDRQNSSELVKNRQNTPQHLEPQRFPPNPRSAVDWTSPAGQRRVHVSRRPGMEHKQNIYRMKRRIKENCPSIEIPAADRRRTRWRSSANALGQRAPTPISHRRSGRSTNGGDPRRTPQRVSYRNSGPGCGEHRTWQVPTGYYRV